MIVPTASFNKLVAWKINAAGVAHAANLSAALAAAKPNWNAAFCPEEREDVNWSTV